MIHTNAGMDIAALRKQEHDARVSAQFDADEKIASLRASIGLNGNVDQCPDVVVRGSEADVKDQFTYEDEHWSETDKQLAASKRIRRAREYGNLRPVQILVDEDHQLIGPKVRDKFELEAVAQGVFCWRCTDSQPESRVEREEKHRRLSEVFPRYRIPDGLSVDDCCCTCGAILGLREKRVS